MRGHKTHDSEKWYRWHGGQFCGSLRSQMVNDQITWGHPKSNDYSPRRVPQRAENGHDNKDVYQMFNIPLFTIVPN